MVINHKEIWGSDREELSYLYEKCLPYIKEDPNIIPLLYDATEILLGAADLPTYLFTQQCKDVIGKIKTTNTTKVIQLLHSKFKADEVGNFLFGKSFLRYAVINNLLFCINMYLYNNQDRNDDIQKGKITPKYDHIPFYRVEDAIDTKLPTYVHYNCFFIDLAHPERNSIINIEQIKHALQVFAFFKVAEVETLYVQAGKKVGTRKKGYTNVTSNHITVINSSWNKIVIRDEEFDVSGHFRLQPKGIGRKEVELIWIAPFKKEGYRREGNGIKTQ